MANKLPLPNQCYYSISVFPKNWKTKKADLNLVWKIKYRFYAPGAKPYVVIVKGMNAVKDLHGRQQATEKLLKEEIRALESGYNPHKKEIIRNVTNQEITPDDTLSFALSYALIKARLEPTTRSVIKSEMNGFLKSATLLNYDSMPLKDVRRRHIISILEKCEGTNPRFTDNTFNHYRKDMSILFKELVKREAMEHNPIDEFLEPRKITKKIREVLSKEERIIVDKYLHENYYEFWRFLQIFFHGGCRTSELMTLKVNDVNLETQYYKLTIKKGKQRIETLKLIKNIALPYWQELLSNANTDYYVFSKGLKPGLKQIQPYQITKRWSRLVKKKLGIGATFYSLKHLHTDSVAELLSLQEAANHNSHTNISTTEKYYAVNEKRRKDDRVKSLQNKFA